MINQAFKAFDIIDSQLDGDIMEISVKQSQIVLSFYDELIVNMDDIDMLNKLGDKLQVSDITCFQNQLYVAMRGIRDIDSFGKESMFISFYEVIKVLRDIVCACPALEYVISREYLKVYLDLANIKLSDLWRLIDVFKQDPFIEFSGDRPYLLFINENMMITEEMQ